MKSLSFIGLPKHAITKGGRVYSHHSNRFLSPCMRGEYLAIGVYFEGKRISHSIHRLVALAYIPNPEDKPCVNHIDGNKLNNDVSNLEWTTYSENAIHAVETGLKGQTINHYRNISDEDVRCVCRMLQDGYRVKDVVDSLGISQAMVSSIKRGDNYKDISIEFDLNTIPYKSRVSTDKVIKICEMLSQRFPVAKIVSATGCSVLTIKRIKKRETYATISQNYKW